MSFIVLLARILYAGSLLVLGINNLVQPQGMARYAASKDVPRPRTLVPVSGGVIVLGSLSVMLGVFPRIGALLILVFLIPVTIIMHNFWTVRDPEAQRNEQIHFWKNMALIGGALLVLYFGSGPLSLTGSFIELH